MLKSLLLGGLAAAAFIPSLASAQQSCQDARHDNRVAGTIIGAGLGALLGNAVSEHGGKPGGTIIGGVGGAVIGNQIAGSGTKCGENRYGYYDTAGHWVPRTYTAYGYYDANGQWVANAPAGYGGADPDRGYSQNGYPQNGYAQNGYPQNGYAQNSYDRGYAPPPAPEYGRDATYTDRDRGQSNFAERENRMDQRIRQAMSDGTLNYRDGRHDLRELNDIRRTEAAYRSGDGRLNDDQRADIDHRLDDLHDRLHMTDDQQRGY